MNYTKQRTVKMAEAADAFVLGSGHAVRTTSALSITREIAYSYAEPIAVFDPERPGTILLTREKFSVSTTRHIAEIRHAAERYSVPLEIVDHARVRSHA